MPEVDGHLGASWKRELLIGVAWTVALGVALVFLFALLGGFHGRGGLLVSVATAPIGLVHLLCVGDGIFGEVFALVFQFGVMLSCVLIVRAAWRKFG